MRVPLRVAERKNLPQFGDAKFGEQNVTLLSPDFVSIEHPGQQLEEDGGGEDPGLSKTLANFISKQNERNMARGLDINTDDPMEPEVVPLNVYKPPVGAVGTGTSSNFGFGDRPQESGTENTLRVSNLTKSVTEDDLRDLFDRFGRIHRISLPKLEKFDTASGIMIKEPRGFAYIAFTRHEDAENALDRLQGYGYDHLILKLEWATPNKGDGAGGGGGGHMSGYGTKLAQDTTEKVSYHSHGQRV